MDFNEYQMKARTTDLITYGREKLKPHWMYYVLGMAGEMGELQEKIKKLYRDHEGDLTHEIKIELAKELGDIMWYMSQFCEKGLQMEFNEIPKMNIEKLASRKERSKLQGKGDNR